jgi:hypothetical protein
VGAVILQERTDGVLMDVTALDGSPLRIEHVPFHGVRVRPNADDPGSVELIRGQHWMHSASEGVYEIVGIVVLEESRSLAVSYRRASGSSEDEGWHTVWTRSVSAWFQEVRVERTEPRFRRVE